MESLPYVLEVGTQEVILTPDPAHEFTATTEQVALGYGVSASAIREHKRNRGDELVEGKHWVVRNSDTLGGQQDMTLWTKRGIVRLGFFIRSARARLFRDMAEDLVISALQPTAPARHPSLISARLIGEASGQSNREATSFIRRRGVTPVAHFLDSRCHAPSYLYVLADVERVYQERGYPHQPFQAFQGDVLTGLAPVVRVVEKQMRTKAQRQRLPSAPPKPQSFLGMVNRVQAAQELAQLELRRYELMQALA